MTQPQLNHLYKLNEPICLNGQPLLKNNLWNFRMGFDHLMHNTQCDDFVLPFDENNFSLVFDFHDMEKKIWSDIYSTYNKNDIFVEGKDVYSGQILPSAMTYVWVRRTAVPDNIKALQQTYNDMVRYQKKYQNTQQKYEKLKTKVMQHPEFLNGMSLEEFLKNLT